MAGILHDIGKIGVPDHILNKPGKLTLEEFEIIKDHPKIGYEICKPIKFFNRVREIIRHHHEKLNGKGYPDGLKENEITIGARIMTIADIFDALTSSRSYRAKMTKEEGINILRKCVKNNEIDGELTELFITLIDSLDI